MRHLLVIGGDAAGMSAASRARRANPALHITALEATRHVSYSACGLPYLVAGLVPDGSRLVARTPEQFRVQQIEVLTEQRAMAIDLARGSVRARDATTGAEAEHYFDRLVIGTGARPRALGLPREDLPGIFRLHDLDDGAALRAWATGADVRSAVVVGGGYLGVEMVETFLSLGLRVTVVQRGRQVLGNLEPDLAAQVQAEMERQGASVHLQRTVAGIEGDPRRGVRAVVLDSGERIEAELLLVAVGVVPNAEIAATAGLRLGARGAIAVDATQRTSDDVVFAAGDCAEAYHRVLGGPDWIPLGTTANKQGRVAGENAAGGQALFGGMLGTAITRVCDLEVARTGLSLAQATAAGRAAVAVTIHSTDVAGYFPGAAPLTVCLVGERGTGRLLGGQLVGGGGAKRVDTVATALHAGLAADDLGQVDLAYAPPFSSVWDPVLVAAQALAREL